MNYNDCNERYYDQRRNAISTCYGYSVDEYLLCLVGLVINKSLLIAYECLEITKVNNMMKYEKCQYLFVVYIVIII